MHIRQAEEEKASHQPHSNGVCSRTVRLQGRSGDVSTATPDDIISNRVAQNARYYQHKKDRPESTHLGTSIMVRD
jgi:hypothetical protein